MRIRWFIASVLIANSSVASASDPACAAYEPAVTTVTGKLERRTYPGPPNYESVQAGDDAETGLYLHLASPVCINATPGDEINREQRDVLVIQLNLDAEQYAALRPLLGKTITLRGTLYAAHTAHHHAPSVLNFAGTIQAGE